MKSFLSKFFPLMAVLSVMLVVCPAEVSAQCPGGVCSLQPAMIIPHNDVPVQSVGLVSARSLPGPVIHGPVMMASQVNACPVRMSPHIEHRSVGITIGGRRNAASFCPPRCGICHAGSPRPVIAQTYNTGCRSQRTFGVSFHSTRLIR